MSITVLETVKRKLKAHAWTLGAGTANIGAGIVVMFEELLPEPLAKPIVVATVLGNIAVNLWNMRRLRRLIHR